MIDGFKNLSAAAPIRRRQVVSGMAWSLGALALAPMLPGAMRAALAAAPTEGDKRDLSRVEDYFNGITTMQARFLQLSPNGRTAEGNLFISRPGRLRFEYDPPVPYLLICDGSQVIFYDKELDTPTYVSLSSTPLEFLLGKEVRLSGLVTVTNVERRPGILRITLVQSSSPKDGQVIITFTERPIEVKKWALVDAKGTTIEVAIFDPRLGLKLDPTLFTFDNKRIRENRSRGTN